MHVSFLFICAIAASLAIFHSSRGSSGFRLRNSDPGEHLTSAGRERIFGLLSRVESRLADVFFRPIEAMGFPACFATSP